jgi:hypothetical protein
MYRMIIYRIFKVMWSTNWIRLKLAEIFCFHRVKDAKIANKTIEANPDFKLNYIFICKNQVLLHFI